MDNPTYTTPDTLPNNTITIIVEAAINKNGISAHTERTGIIIPLSALTSKDDISHAQRAQILLMARKHITGLVKMSDEVYK
jgi:hypothetical protein